MREQIEKYVRKIERQGLAAAGDAVFLCRDADVFSNRAPAGRPAWCGDVFGRMNVNAFLFALPAEPYRSLIDHIVNGPSHVFGRREGPGGECVVPKDCETRTFFHDLPVVREEDPAALSEALSTRKSAILPGRGIAARGLFTPEQAFSAFSSTCFSLFVNYFTDVLTHLEEGSLQGRPPDLVLIDRFMRIFRMACDADDASEEACRCAASALPGPPLNEEAVVAMLSETGRLVVARRLVDSSFGNISYVFGDRIFISQTGSSLDELSRCIDEVPLDGSSSAGITASSELSAHMGIFRATGDRAILHGHPKFAVVMSMCCGKRDCDRSACFSSCPHERDVGGIPVIPGEIGTGPTGLVNTVPEAMKKTHAAIVYGHGVFTSGKADFRTPFQMLCEIEGMAAKEYILRVKSALGSGASGREHLFNSDRH